MEEHELQRLATLLAEAMARAGGGWSGELAMVERWIAEVGDVLDGLHQLRDRIVEGDEHLRRLRADIIPEDFDESPA